MYEVCPEKILEYDLNRRIREAIDKKNCCIMIRDDSREDEGILVSVKMDLFSHTRFRPFGWD